MKVKIKIVEFETYINRTDVLLTQKDFARKAGITNVQISRMKSNGKYGSKKTAAKILKAFPELKFDDIFFVVN